ncbi:hypothetical protein LTR08_004045 [Meristemomyces frigidus]|nr:hypothetical protein LTR08_004045 [Meristemomyces frigidus]
MLARAFTTRRNKPEMQISTPMFGRAASLRGGKPVSRAQISSPVALLSTSNVLLNNAQSIAGTAPIEYRSISSGSSTSGSADDSGASTANGSIHSTESVTDASSVDESPISSEPKHNHLSCYFNPAVDTQTRSPSVSPRSSIRSCDTPRVPQRAPSHSKKAHEGLHRMNSVKRLLSPPPTGRDATRSSTDFFNGANSSFVEAPMDSPFGRELAQLDAVAEEYGQVVYDAETDADMNAMTSFGLAHFAASDYLSEIQGLICDTFDSEPAHGFSGWI